MRRRFTRSVRPRSLAGLEIGWPLAFLISWNVLLVAGILVLAPLACR
jgi:hypothetical protein